MTAIEMNPER